MLLKICLFHNPISYNVYKSTKYHSTYCHLQILTLTFDEIASADTVQSYPLLNQGRS
jgi:hypothetical protein